MRHRQPVGWWSTRLPGGRTWTWGARLGYDAIQLGAVNRRAVEFVGEPATGGPDGPTEHVVDGAVGPRGDGCVVGEAMSAPEAAAYHGLPARAFAEAGAAMMTAVTMTQSTRRSAWPEQPARSACRT